METIYGLNKSVPFNCINSLTAGAPVLPHAAVDLFGFSAGQATFDAMVEVAPA